MIKREEVEEMLIGCGEPPLNTKDDLCLVPATTLAELARTWLRVNDAPVIAAQSAERAMFESNQMPMPRYGDPIKLVLVPEADSGGDRG